MNGFLNASELLSFSLLGGIFFFAFLGLVTFQVFQILRLKQGMQNLMQGLERKFTEHEQHFSEQRHHLMEQLHHSTEKQHQSQHQTQIQLMEQVNHLKTELLTLLGSHNENNITKLKDISFLLERRLNEGFEKTSITFTDIVKRLALIDDAQKKLTELSSNVVSLQEILVDKRSRGAFGEIQLNNLVQNVLPANHYAFQHPLSNGTRVDCILFLPEPTGNVAIDSKFPLENYQIMTDFNSSETERKKAQQLFRQDIKKHIQDIASKYIVPNETATGAILFIAAEAVFSEIHAHFPDLVELAQRSNVWLASPTTLMAILTTARAVLKDQATRQHIHIIQKHLRDLAKDFERFDTRMQTLAKHIDQANQDVQQVQTSAKKITHRFSQIEKAEITKVETEVASGTEAFLLEIEETTE